MIMVSQIKFRQFSTTKVTWRMLQWSIIIVILSQVSPHHFFEQESSEGTEIAGEKTFVYGPGLKRDVVLPVRYFYIQFVDKSGKNITRSLGTDNLRLEFSSSSGRVRAWRELLDRNDGSYIVRFRLMETYADLTIEIKYKDSHIADSPYVLKGQFYHEQCHCPEEDGDEWFSNMKCPATHGQIERDLSKFPIIALNRLRTEGYERFNNRDVCHYSVINGKAYSRCLDSIKGFKKDIDDWLLSILRKVRLPDVEFFANTGDWPLIYTFENPFPILSWCGADNAADITWPTYYATQGILDELRTRPMSMANVQGNSGPVWDNKIEKAVFRGMDSNIQRLNLIMTRRKMTNLYDVGLSRTFYHPYDEEKYGPHNRISFFDFFKFKYIINIDGTVAAYRLPFLLVGDSLVLKQKSPYYEHFYKELTPGVHYVEFKNDLSDLDEKVLWAKSHDEEARKIAKAGQTYARDNLMPQHAYCYTYLLFKEYAKRQQQKPEIFEGMELVDQPKDQDSVCDCHRKASEGKEEL